MDIIELSDIKEYLKSNVLNGSIQPFFAVKSAKVFARPGKIGEIVNTFSHEGNYSTTKTVLPNKDGKLGFVVTNEVGEQTVEDFINFMENYKPTETQGEFELIYKEKLILKLNEYVQFRNKYGNTYRVLPNNYIVADENNNFYELTPQDFVSNYKIINKKFDIATDNLIFN